MVGNRSCFYLLLLQSNLCPWSAVHEISASVLCFANVVVWIVQNRISPMFHDAETGLLTKACHFADNIFTFWLCMCEHNVPLFIKKIMHIYCAEWHVQKYNYFPKHRTLTHEELEMHWHVISDGLLLKYQAINIHSADSVTLDLFG